MTTVRTASPKAKKTRQASRRSLDGQTKAALHSVPGFCAVKDAGFTYVFGNDAYRKLVGLGERSIEGLTDHDLPCEVAEYADIFQEQDRLAMRQHKELRIIDIHRYPEIGWRTLLLVKRPFQLVPGGKAGTIFHATDITALITGMLNGVFDVPSLAKGQDGIFGKWEINRASGDIHLSRRESEVLFYLLRAGTAKTIAAHLNLSPRTVEQYIDALKTKFKALNKTAMIKKAIAMGYLFSLQFGAFEQHLSMIVS